MMTLVQYAKQTFKF